MRTLVSLLTVLFVLALPSYAHRPYTLDQPIVTDILNDYWSIYGTAEGTAKVSGPEDMVHASTCWYEWNTMKCSWTTFGPFSELQRLYFDMVKISGVNAEGKQARGYLWPGFHSEKWFGLHEHFDQMPRFVCAVYNEYMWSRDERFLRKMLPNVEAVMDYMLETMDGRNGVIKCPGDNNGLSDTGVPSTYMDCLREGYIVTWINAGFYTALNNMSDLEYLAGNRQKARYYADLYKNYPKEFDKHLWNPDTQRYAGWKDILYKFHDAGYTYVNTEALARGLGNPEYARCVFDWLDRGKAQPTVKGAHIGSTDIYQLVVAPRMNTLRVPNEDWDLWSMPDRNAQGDAYQFGYGAALEDGGTMLWANYYDVQARLKWLDADSAWRKFADMLFRCANDPRFLTVGHDHKYSFIPYNRYGEHYLELGTDYPFPESGISAMSMLYGFMGVQPCREGFKISPNLPTGLILAECDDVNFMGKGKTVGVYRGRLVADDKLGKSVTEIEQASLPAFRIFNTSKPFNKIGIMLGTYGQPGINANVTLSVLRDGIWRDVFCRRLDIVDDNVWTYFCVPLQRGKQQYRLSVANFGLGKIAWYQNTNSQNALRLIKESAELVEKKTSPSAAAELTAEVLSPFSKVSVLTDNKNQNASTINLKLSRRMGDGWYKVTEQSFKPNGWIPLTISDQPKGDYNITACYENGIPADSIKEVRFSRGTYSVRVVPGNYRAEVKAGNYCIFEP